VAKQAILGEMLLINSVDYSNYIKSAQLNPEGNVLDATTMGSANWEENLIGIRKGSLDINALDDVAAGALDSAFWALFGTVVTFELRLNNGARSTSNPAYTGNIAFSQFAIGGDVGDLAQKGLKFPTSGVILRQTS
jgi:hypothetical protein